MGDVINVILDVNWPGRNSILGVTPNLYTSHSAARTWRDAKIGLIDMADHRASDAVKTVNGMYDLMIEIDPDLMG